MATTDAGLASDAHEDSGHGHSGHGHGDHDHPSYLAHHFDTPEQQFDSGKLGMWLFLVTEVLFFSGMFCAYAIFRAWRPEVFEGCSEFLNTKLGAINTGVLLFSSFTMAWGVRCAQKEQHKLLTVMLATTLSCATMFLGVKAIEYSHKWHMGLLPAGMFSYDPANPHPHVLQSENPLLVNGTASTLTSKVAELDGNESESNAADELSISGTNQDGTAFSSTVGVSDKTTVAELVAAINQAATGATADLSEDGYLVMKADSGSSDGLKLAIAPTSEEAKADAFPAFATFDPSPDYLAYICAPFAIILIGIGIWLVMSFLKGDAFQVAVAKPLFVVFLCFFAGVGLGMILESGGEEAHHGDDHHAVAAVDDQHGHADGEEHAHEEGDAAEGHSEGESHTEEAVAVAAEQEDASTDLIVRERLATDATNTGLQDELSARRAQSQQAGGGIVYDSADDNATIAKAKDDVLRPSRAGVFFSIYYCMTGIHAIHILAGIAVLIWLLVRSVRQDFNRNYFGPVDYVGLYWHIVDMIWIYLFPLMYLIR